MMELPKYDPIGLGIRLECLIAEKQVTQECLAQVLEISQPRVSQIVNGHGSKDVRLATLDKMVRFFNTTPDYLMYGLLPKYRA